MATTHAGMAEAGNGAELVAMAKAAGFEKAQHDGRWLKFEFEHDGVRYQAEAMIFDEPSEYGIGGTAISKLGLRSNRARVFHFDRALDECEAGHEGAAARAALAFAPQSQALDILAAIYTGQNDFFGLLDARGIVPVLNTRDGYARLLAESYDVMQGQRGSRKRAVRHAGQRGW